MSGAQQINNPTGAFGYTDLQNKLGHMEFEMVAGAVVTAGYPVFLNSTGQVVNAATDSTDALIIGIAREGANTGSSVPVIVHGIAENVLADGATTAGVLLKQSATTIGYVLATATPAVGEVIGVAISASAGGSTDVWVLPAKVLT